MLFRSGLWKPEDTDRNRITGVEFAALSDEEALDRVLDYASKSKPSKKAKAEKPTQNQEPTKGKWIPAKSTDKLKSLKNQEGARGRFLSRLEAVLMS